MNNTKPIFKVLDILIILLLLIVTIAGIYSFNTSHSYEFVNQYGDSIQMWGAGIYAHDSYFKAPIFIGSDVTIILFVVPLSIVTFLRTWKEESVENYIRSFGMVSMLLYYSSSIAFGVTYNSLHLVYITLFGVCFFSTCMLLAKLHTFGIRQEKVCSYHFTKGMKVFLLVAGVSLFVAWLPDIIMSITSGTSLELIEVYTTEITYVLDMGIISPLIFITYYLIRHEDFLGYVFLRMIFKICICIGVMLPIQTIFQLLAGISIPIPALITKCFIFVVMSIFATYFEYCIKRKTQYI
ncbi:hypothetical protein KGF39_09480 [Clostridioides sp. ZZV14-6345]|nr:hypothetical protein [Clostridioides sp. ZZV14-6345]